MRSLLLALALLALGSPGPARAEDDAAPPRIYRWVDENGIAHYTADPDRIPRSLRRRYDLPAEPLRNEPLDARAPAPPPAKTPSAGPDTLASQEQAAGPVPAATPAAGPDTLASQEKAAGPVPAATPAAGPDAWASQEKTAAPAPDRPSAAPTPEPGVEWSEGAPTDVAAGPVGGSSGERLSQLELRIAELSASIAADEDALSGWIGDPAAGDAITLADKPEFREIAQRLPKRIQELEALQRERDALQTAVP